MTEQWQELKETITEMRDNGGTGTQQEVCKFLANYMEILEKQMQHPCEDCISREAVINRIANTCFWLSADNWKELIKCINSISPVTPTEKQQPCEDCISRETVLEQIDDWRKNELLRVTNPLHYLRKRIGSLPSVAPQPKAESEE